MSLLDNASLVLTPNAYKEGKLYSVIPSDGNGDFTATRATTATRVNAAGLVDLVPYNLLRYSEQFENAAWTKQTASITSNAAVAPDGTTTADLVTPSASDSFVRQTFTAPSGQYTFSVWLKSATGSSFSTEINIGNAIRSTITITNDWQRFTTTQPLTTVFSVVIGGFNSLSTGENLYVWGAQVVEGDSARDYLRTETRLNIPRVDYSLGGCPNILLEPQRTNLLLQSEDISSASWAKGNTPAITSNIAIAPDGTTSADGIQSLTGAVYRNISQNFTVASNSTVTGSVFVKKETSETFYGGFSILFQGGIGKVLYVIVDAVNGTGTVSGSALTGTIKVEDYDNYWRISATTTDNGSNTVCRFTYEATLSTNGTTLNAAAGSVRTIWGAQLEVGAYATSYIPTTTASVTRNQDVITRNDIYTNGLITAAGGTWFVELRNNVPRVRDAGGWGIALTNNNTIYDFGFLILNPSGVSSRTQILTRIGGIGATIYTTTADTCKLAIKWNGSTADVFQNGVKVVSSVAFTNTAMQVLSSAPIDTPKYINETALFPTPLTDDQCIALTQ